MGGGERRRGPDLAATLVFSHVLHLRTDFAEESGFVLRIEAERLPRTGKRPTSARHLLNHHDNAYELVRVLLDGPTRIEVLAVSLDIEQPAS